MLEPTKTALLALCRVRPSEGDRRIAAGLGPGVDWTLLARLAVRGGVAGLVLRGLEGLDSVPRQVRLELTRAALLTEAHNKLLLETGLELCAAAEAEGLTLVPLKGTALNLLGVYDAADLRAQCDLDLLVRRDQLQAVDALLRRHGLVEDTSHREQALRHSHHLKYDLPGAPMRVMLELHWTGLLAQYSDRAVETGILDRAAPRDVGGRQVRLLAAEDLLFLVILHFCVHRFRAQLKWLVDIAELGRFFADRLAADRLWALARRVGALRATAHAVDLARDLLDAPLHGPPARPLLLPLLRRVARAEALVESQPQPAWRQRALLDLLAYDSPLHGARFLAHKGAELLERAGGPRLPLGRRDPPA